MATEPPQPETPTAETPATPLLRPPVLTDAGDVSLAVLRGMFVHLREENTVMAAAEAERLAPYFDELRAQTERDLKEPSNSNLEPLRETLAAEDGLAALFNTVAEKTKNTILSDIALVPMALVNSKAVRMEVVRFGGTSHYRETPFIFGFWQNYTRDKKERSSVSIPFLAFDDQKLASTTLFGPEKMLRHFQHVMSSGNHDMLHHYANTLLNASIAETSKTGGTSLRHWSSQYFGQAHYAGGDSDIRSWESWLMLNHARLRRGLEEGPAGDELQAHVDGFFDELERIGHEMVQLQGPLEAHKAVDYFGSLLCFALIRFMPMDHPMMQHAITRLEKADPGAYSINLRKDDILTRAQKDKSLMKEALANYAAMGTTFGEKQDYADLKALEIMEMMPTMAHLFSPGAQGSTLQYVQERVGRVNREMFRATLDDMAYIAPPKHHWLRRWMNKP